MGRLSPREREIVRLVALGKTTKEISAELGIAESTVNWHVTNVLGKLDASSRAEAVALALTEGLLDAERPMERTGPARPQPRRPLALRIAGALVALAALCGGGVLVLASLAGSPPDLGRWLPPRVTNGGPSRTTVPPSMSTVDVASPSPMPPQSAPPSQPTQSAPPLPTIPAPIPSAVASTRTSVPASIGVPSLGPLPSVTAVPSLPLPTPTLVVP
jgi:DNA-binding CsgD family transcriptional regulator